MPLEKVVKYYLSLLSEEVSGSTINTICILYLFVGIAHTQMLTGMTAVYYVRDDLRSSDKCIVVLY